MQDRCTCCQLNEVNSPGWSLYLDDCTTTRTTEHNSIRPVTVIGDSVVFISPVSPLGMRPVAREHSQTSVEFVKNC